MVEIDWILWHFWPKIMSTNLKRCPTKEWHGIFHKQILGNFSWTMLQSVDKLLRKLWIWRCRKQLVWIQTTFWHVLNSGSFFKWEDIDSQKNNKDKIREVQQNKTTFQDLLQERRWRPGKTSGKHDSHSTIQPLQYMHKHSCRL